MLLQVAGHLKGCARQEWILLCPAEKGSYDTAVVALHNHVDPGSKVVMAQEFRHTMQNEGERVAEFSRRLKKTFCIAYGGKSISQETSDALLFGQLNEGLIYSLMEVPAVSDATSYQALYLATKTEEKRQAELQKRRQYKPKGNHVPLIGKC